MSVVAARRPPAGTPAAAPAERPASARQPDRWQQAAPYVGLAAVALLYLALTIARRYEVVADELAAFGAGLRIAVNGPLTPNLVEQLFVNPYTIAVIHAFVGPEYAFVAARWLQGLFGLITLLGTFALTRRLTSRPWLGVVAAWFLTLSPFFIHTHHHLRMDNPETTGFVLTLLALAAWIRQPTTPRLLLVLLATAFLVASKLLGLLFLPGLLGVALAWRLRHQGGLALSGILVGALWLGWVLPQTLMLRARLEPAAAQAVGLSIAAALTLAALAAFARPLAGLVRRPRVVLAGLLVAGLLLFVLAVSPLSSDRQRAFVTLAQYQLQRFTIALNEDHPGNQERFPEGFTWYLSKWSVDGLAPETLALAGAGIFALAADRRRRGAAKLIPRPGAGLLLLLPLISGFAFLAGSRSWFVRYSLPLFPVLAVLAALGFWELARRLGDWLAPHAPTLTRGRWQAGPLRLAVVLGILFLAGLGTRNLVTIVEQDIDVGERGTFFSLREPFGHEVQPGDVILADHENSWIYDSGLFLEAETAYPLMMLGVPKDATLVNVRANGPRLADWLLTDHPVNWDAFRLVYAVDASDVAWHHDSGVVRYFVYRNRYSAAPAEDVRLDIKDLLESATVQGGNDPGRLFRWTVDGRRHQIVVSHPGDGVPNRITVPLKVQAGDTLRGGYGFNPETDPLQTDGATVRITVRDARGEREVYADESVRPPADLADCNLATPGGAVCRPGFSWTYFSIDLLPFAGQSVEVTFETGPGSVGESTYDWTGWSDLRVSRVSGTG